MYTWICKYIYTYVCMFVNSDDTHFHTRAGQRELICIRMYMYMYMYIYIYMYTRTYTNGIIVYVSCKLHTYIHT
jgi:hypothetical protein